MATRHISSRDNPRLRALVELAGSAKARRRAGQTLLEGIHLCDAWAAQGGHPPTTIVTTEAALAIPDVSRLVPGDHPDVLVLTGNLFSEISQVENGIGIAYVISPPRPELPARLDTDAVFLDRLQDPGNVGTLLRACAAAGIRRVITAAHTVGCWSPKVLRAGMGAHFALLLHETVTWELLAARLAMPVTMTAGNAASSLYEHDLRAPRLWVFGNEGGGVESPAGLPPGVTSEWVGIPQEPAVESLNVAMAATICLFEQRRQRLAGERPGRA